MNALDWVYPPVCFACRQLLPMPDKQRRKNRLCFNCETLFTILPPPVCARCGHPAEAGQPDGAPACANCNGKIFYFKSHQSIFAYADLIREAIHDVKFRSRKETAIGLGELFARHIRPETLAGLDCLAPVPMHPKKIRARGFNQAQILAEAPARFFNIKIFPHALNRIRETPPLSGLTPQRRAEEMASAFEVNKNFNARGKHICLIDDIYTTGATLNACAKKLREAGAEVITCMTLAVAVKSN